jgi:hypothetical protein
MQIEGFAGPAGSDGLGVGMLEAVHHSQFITLGLQPPLREGEMPGQILIVHPRFAEPPIRFVKHPTVGFTGDGDPALMHYGVMPFGTAGSSCKYCATRTFRTHFRDDVGGPG